MKHLRALRLAVCVALMTVAVIGSTVTRDGSVLLHQQNYNQVVGVGSADATFFRHFYVAVAKSPRWKISRRDVIVPPFETPPLRDGFSGTFIVDIANPDQSEFASRLRDLYERRDADNPGLYLGLAAGTDDPVTGGFGPRRIPIGKLDLPGPGSNLALVRFDINRWEVSDGLVSYDINVSYWGKPVPVAETVVAMAADAEAIATVSY